MSKGCARSSKKGCGGRAAGRAVHIDELSESRFAPERLFEVTRSVRGVSRNRYFVRVNINDSRMTSFDSRTHFRCSERRATENRTTDPHLASQRASAILVVVTFYFLVDYTVQIFQLDRITLVVLFGAF
jgi:hypothetical protein